MIFTLATDNNAGGPGREDALMLADPVTGRERTH